jgi:hypothetical protein
VREIAEIIAGIFSDCRLIYGPPGADNRSYRVNFDKIHEVLPGFRCEWDAQRGAEQLHALFSRIQMTPALFNARPFTRLKMLQHLLATGQLDPNFFWTPWGASASAESKFFGAPIARAA